MSRSANVLSVQTLKDFKNAMINFAEDARNALGGVDMELRKMRDWLERDQLGYWQAQVKKRYGGPDAGAVGPAPPQDQRSRGATPSPTPSRRRRCARR